MFKKRKSIIWAVILCFLAQIVIQPSVITAKAENTRAGATVYERNGISLDRSIEKTVDLSAMKGQINSLKQGSIHARFRLSDIDTSKEAGLRTLFSISNSEADATYAAFYVNVSGTVGYEIRNAETTISSGSASADIKNLNWHTVSYVFSESPASNQIYFDGELIFEGINSTFLSGMTDNVNTARIGSLARNNKRNNIWCFNGDIDSFSILNTPISEEEIKELHASTKDTKAVYLAEGAAKTETVNLYKGGYDNSNSYRIPSLLTLSDKKTVIAAIDKRHYDGSDWYNIDTVIRRSEDNGKTWGDSQVLINLPEVSPGAKEAAFNIDASMLEDKTTGEVFLLVDMFPESLGLVSGNGVLETGSGWKTVNNKEYFILGDYPTVPTINTPSVRTKDYLLDMATGIVYEPDGATPTVYTVPDFGSGQLLKNGEPAGNIFLYSDNGNAGELKAVRTSYLWLISSKDKGLTWSKPVDITGQVKEEWMKFIGTGPGVGIQIETGAQKGRLVFPVYYTNANIGGSQCSAIIYSDDNGKTWQTGESPIKLLDLDPKSMNDSSKIITESQVVEITPAAGMENANTMLKLFCRNRSGKVMVATSNDGGATWSKIAVDELLPDPYCQMSIVKYPELIEGKQAFIFSNPATAGRNDGTIRLGLYDPQTDTFDWKYSKLLHPGRFQYSSVTVLGDNTIGILYEGDAPFIRYTSFNLDWIMKPDIIVPMGTPEIKNITLKTVDKTAIFYVDFNHSIMTVGEPVLNMKLDNSLKTAKYVSGSGTTQLVFEYKMNASDKGTLTINGVFGPNGSIENRNNLLPVIPENTSYIFKNFSYNSDVGEAPNGGAVAPPVKPTEPEKPQVPQVSDKSDLVTTGASSKITTAVKKSDGFFYSADGKKITNAIVKTENGVKYILNKDGSKYVSSIVTTADNKKFIVDENGIIVTGKIVVTNGKKYYMTKSSGKMVVNKIFKLNGKKYFAGKAGDLTISKWVTVDGKKYYFNKDGVLAKTK